MAPVVSPLADEWTDEYALYAPAHLRIAYSRPLWHFLRDCRGRGVKPVLLTEAGAMLSPQLYSAMTEYAAAWAFRDDRGVFNARSGHRISSIPELWRGASNPERHAPLEARAATVPAVFFDIYAGDRAALDTVVGPLADHAVGALGGGALARSGRVEPLTSAWDQRELTALAQRQMPAGDPILGASDPGAWVGMTVARTHDGLVERVQGGVPLPQLGDSAPETWRDLVMPAVTQMLSGLVDDFRPRIALVSSGMLHQAGGRYGFCVGAQPVDAPLAVLIGPRAVRDLRLDFAALQRRHDVTMLGPGRVPSALVRMTGKDALWAQLRAFAFDLDPERLSAVLSATLGGQS